MHDETYMENVAINIALYLGKLKNFMIFFSIIFLSGFSVFCWQQILLELIR